MTPAQRFKGALRAWWAMGVDELEGRVPAVQLARSRYLALRRYQAACPDADAVYRAEGAAWTEETGRDYRCRERLASCRCGPVGEVQQDTPPGIPLEAPRRVVPDPSGPDGPHDTAGNALALEAVV